MGKNSETTETKIRERFKWQKEKHELVGRTGNDKAQMRLFAYMDALNFALEAMGALQNRLLKLMRCGRFSYTIYSAELHQRPLLDLETYMTEAEAASQRTEGEGQHCKDCGAKGGFCDFEICVSGRCPDCCQARCPHAN